MALTVFLEVHLIRDCTICITGGTGFIGAVLVGALCSHNKVIVLDNLSRNALQSYPYADHPNLTVKVCDVLDRDLLAGSFYEADYIIHCAGIAGIKTVGQRPTYTMNVNISGSINVYEEARKVARAKRIISFSTSEVFGSVALASRESDNAVIATAGHPRWTYAVSKLAEEHLSQAYFEEYRMPMTVVRPFNVYGPGQVGEGAMKNFILQALRNDPITIHGAGNQVRAWCYISDMVDGVLLCMEKEEAIGQTFNIGNARSVQTIYALASTITRVLNSDSQIIFGPPLDAEIELRIPCVTKAEEVLGYRAKIDLEEGIVRTAEYYIKQGLL